LTDAQTDEAISSVAEAIAHDGYRSATDRADGR
jgi:hypothetical protein